ncbi:Uu.00g005610.m01.CDS01 [Anthostomella pinea]|uniref:Uu.00g005610.m01.CDS01 n=1 Tax=Anthostomella pinea TaxID=933095 RepID=A0AAI8VL46_9PEZI|nr:Uu.00g005610.m01.CDS01 [Anthostomella pinea]
MTSRRWHGPVRAIVNFELGLLQIDAPAINTDPAMSAEELPWLSKICRLAVTNTIGPFADIKKFMHLVRSMPHFREVSAIVPWHLLHFDVPQGHPDLPKDGLGFHQCDDFQGMRSVGTVDMAAFVQWFELLASAVAKERKGVKVSAVCYCNELEGAPRVRARPTG